MMSLKIAGVAAAGLLLSGCATLFRGSATYASPPIKDTVQFDLIPLLVPPTANALAPARPEPATLEEAFARFNRTPVDRNRVAGALLLASDRSCDIYLENLRGYQSGWRTAFSLTSVGLGAAGAIVTGADTARLLSGLTGAASGAQGKLDEHLMGGLGAEILVAGVRAGREQLRAQIVTKMTTPSDYDAWPVELAIADVLRYHGRCNVMSGLTATQRAVESVVTPTNLTVTLAEPGAAERANSERP